MSFHRRRPSQLSMIGRLFVVDDDRRTTILCTTDYFLAIRQTDRQTDRQTKLGSRQQNMTALFDPRLLGGKDASPLLQRSRSCSSRLPQHHANEPHRTTTTKQLQQQTFEKKFTPNKKRQ